MVMLDEAGISRQSLTFGPAQAGQALIKNPSDSAHFMIASSLAASSGSATPLRNQSKNTIEAPVKLAAQHNSQVLYEDQGLPDF